MIERREYDPRREQRRQAIRVALPDDVSARDLDPDARKELRSLTKEGAELVARHLVMAGRLLDEEPEQALAHARAARAMAARIGVVREAVGLAAYATQQWTEALAELRAARRITGRPDHLAVFADCERALGRPERALGYADDPAVPGLAQDERVELIMVLSGARADLGQLDAAVLTLQEPAQRTTAQRPWAARLWYAFADALERAGRPGEARDWFSRSAASDADGATDAVDRLLALDGVLLEDLAEDDDDTESVPDAGLAAYIAQTYSSTVARVNSSASADATESAPQVETSVGVDVSSSSRAAMTAAPSPAPDGSAATAHGVSEAADGRTPSAGDPFAAGDGSSVRAEDNAATRDSGPAAADPPRAALQPTFVSAEPVETSAETRPPVDEDRGLEGRLEEDHDGQAAEVELRLFD